MNNDEITWSLIGNKNQCSFKVKLPQGPQRFCQNQYNITGLCNRGSCPLSNSQYATVLERDGVCYLYMKTAERAHTPNRMWERVKLSANYMQALEQIDVQLAYWPRPMKHKIKQRFTKIKQYLLRMRRLKLKETTELVTVNSKVERRELKREKKAEVIARIDNKIKAELLERLQRGLYSDDILNIEHGFSELLDENEEEENEKEEEEENEAEQEFEREEVDEYIEDIDDLEELGNEDFDEDDSFYDDEAPEDDDDDEEEEPKEQPKPISRVPTTKKRGPAFLTKGPRKHVKMMYETETERDTHKDKDIDY